MNTTQPRTDRDRCSYGAGPACQFVPFASLADIEACEAIPIGERIQRWDYALNLLDGCRIDPQKPALHATRNGDVDGPVLSWSFAELEQRSVQVANLLRSRGVGPDDTVAIITPTLPSFYSTMIGGFLAARPFPINWMLDAQALADLVERSNARAVIALGPTPGFNIWEHVSGALASLARTPELFTLHDPFAAPHPHDLLTAAAEQPGDRLTFSRETAQRSTIAAYVHSGGTTGHPKIVKITHGGFVYRQWTTNVSLGFRSDDVILSDTPLFHIGGLAVRGLVPVANGATSVVPSLHGARDKTYLASYWRYVEKFGITLVSGVPTTLSMLVKNPPTSENISTLRPFFFTSSTAIAPAVQERIGAITGARALMAYGLTENTSNVTAALPGGPLKVGYSGIRVPYTQVRIAEIDADGAILRDCGPNESGMILVKGPGVSTGYLDPAQDNGVFLPDGFLVTGDLGSLDEDGYLRISGRRKDLIIRSGHNIEPGVIEDALTQSKWVALAAAIGRPDAHAGELPIAYVQLHPGADVSADELLRYAAQHIPERPAVPKQIIILDKLPLTAVGKPIKHLLQIDAANRVFNEALQPVPGAWTLDVSNAPSSGLKLTLTLKGNTPGARQKAHEVLSAFSTPYSIEEAAS